MNTDSSSSRGESTAQQPREFVPPVHRCQTLASSVVTFGSQNIFALLYQVRRRPNTTQQRARAFLTVLNECHLPPDGGHHGVRTQGVQVGARQVGGAVAQHFLQVYGGVQLEPRGQKTNTLPSVCLVPVQPVYQFKSHQCQQCLLLAKWSSLLPEDGLEDLQLGGSVLVDPHVDEFIQPGEDMREEPRHQRWSQVAHRVCRCGRGGH